MTKIHAAGCLIYREIQRKNFEYLMLKCTNGMHWTPPKGTLENGEDEKTAAIRETEEEAGLSLKDFELIDGFEKKFSYRAWGKEKWVTYWLAKLKNKDALIKLSSEHTAYDWFNVKNFQSGQYSNFIIHDDTKDLLKSAEEFLIARCTN